MFGVRPTTHLLCITANRHRAVRIALRPKAVSESDVDRVILRSNVSLPKRNQFSLAASRGNVLAPLSRTGSSDLPATSSQKWMRLSI